LADLKQPLLGAYSGRRVIPFRTTDSTEKHSIRSCCGFDILIPQGCTVCVNCATANEASLCVEGEPMLCSRSMGNGNCMIHDLRSHAIAGQQKNVESRHWPAPPDDRLSATSYCG